MRALISRGYVREDLVIWELDANQFEFTWNEFQELLLGARGKGLFQALQAERPALHDQLRRLFFESPRDPEEEKELEYLLEQALFAVEQALPRFPS